MSQPTPSRALARFRILDLTRVRAGLGELGYGADAIAARRAKGVA